MKIVLSKRMKAVADLVPQGSILADVGTDHAFIPIELVRAGRVRSAFAMDVNEGPLARAKEHIDAAGLSGKITVLLTDGLRALLPGEADCAVIAGMGGALTIRILTNDPDKARKMRALVLQPQSEIALVRRFLFEQGFVIDAEDMVFEDGKYYPMMRVFYAADGMIPGEPSFSRKPGESALSRIPEDLAFAFGPCLLAEHHPVLESYLKWDRGIKERIRAQLEANGNDNHPERLAQVNEDLALIGRALRIYAEPVQ